MSNQMVVHVKGLKGLISKMGRMKKSMKQIEDQVAKEIAMEILSRALAKASGPNWKAKVNKYRLRNKRNKKKRYNLSRIEMMVKYDPLTAGLQYPVPVITGFFRRAHKMQRVSNAQYRVYGDSTVANYFIYVHDGTNQMAPRPTIDDSVFETIESGTAQRIAMRVVIDKLGAIK